jgi:hypothetical protein
MPNLITKFFKRTGGRHGSSSPSTPAEASTNSDGDPSDIQRDRDIRDEPVAPSPSKASTAPLTDLTDPLPTSSNAPSHAPPGTPSVRLREPPSQPERTQNNANPTDDERSKITERLVGALSIGYDIAKIVAENFPLPGLESVIELADYIKTLRQVRYSSVS